MTPKQNNLVTIVYWCCIGIVLCFLAVILRDGCRGILCKGTDAQYSFSSSSAVRPVSAGLAIFETFTERRNCD